ncbi:MAG TPA: AmmeMemoRadiSam system protein A [Steroidobacteraceae bacterium]|nr:AmmeMemoRadiSam system protein A [Steroidobacteraceae bacterium]
MLELSERSRLLELARESIARGSHRSAPEPLPQGEWSPRLLAPTAAFVTLTLEGELRGCRGTTEPQRSLADEVWRSAWLSGFADPRFPPIAAEQATSLRIAISVLTALELIACDNEAALIESLVPGVDGLVLRCGAARATFLPAVWKSLQEPREFVRQLRRKAGLYGSHWPPGMTALRYRAETFDSGQGAALAA